MLREQRAALEKELGSFQAKAQELQAMQIKVSLSRCFTLVSIPVSHTDTQAQKVTFRNQEILSMFFLVGLDTRHWPTSPCHIVPAGEGAAGEPELSNLPPPARERHPERRGQLGHQPDGEQVSVAFSRLDAAAHDSRVFFVLPC